MGLKEIAERNKRRSSTWTPAVGDEITLTAYNKEPVAGTLWDIREVRFDTIYIVAQTMLFSEYQFRDEEYRELEAGDIREPMSLILDIGQHVRIYERDSAAYDTYEHDGYVQRKFEKNGDLYLVVRIEVRASEYDISEAQPTAKEDIETLLTETERLRALVASLGGDPDGTPSQA